MKRFDNEKLFINYVTQYGLNLYLGAGFSVYAYNENSETLPLGNAINKRIIDTFDLNRNRKYTLSKTCQKVKKKIKMR